VLPCLPAADCDGHVGRRAGWDSLPASLEGLPHEAALAVCALQRQVLKFFEFTALHRDGATGGVSEDKSAVLFQVFSETSRAAPGKRHWETAESREGTTHIFSQQQQQRQQQQLSHHHHHTAAYGAGGAGAWPCGIGGLGGVGWPPRAISAWVAHDMCRQSHQHAGQSRAHGCLPPPSALARAMVRCTGGRAGWP
jgi:hypothetical protein